MYSGSPFRTRLCGAHPRPVSTSVAAATVGTGSGLAARRNNNTATMISAIAPAAAAHLRAKRKLRRPDSMVRWNAAMSACRFRGSLARACMMASERLSGIVRCSRCGGSNMPTGISPVSSS